MKKELNIYMKIDENNFIFCTSRHIGVSLGGPSHDYLMIEKVCLRNIYKNEINSNRNDLGKEKFWLISKSLF